jgi:hypothetical protein
MFSNRRSNPPTTGCWIRLTSRACARTSRRAQMTRNSSLQVDSSPTRSVRARERGSRPAAACTWPTMSSATFGQSIQKFRARGWRKVNRRSSPAAAGRRTSARRAPGPGGWWPPRRGRRCARARARRPGHRAPPAPRVRPTRRRCCTAATGRRAARTGQVEQVLPLHLVQLQPAGDGVEDAVRSRDDPAGLEPVVVVHRHPRQDDDLLAAQAGDAAAVLRHRQASLRRRDPRAAGGQEVLDLTPLVHAPLHAVDGRTAGGGEGGPVRACLGKTRVTGSCRARRRAAFSRSRARGPHHGVLSTC